MQDFAEKMIEKNTEQHLVSLKIKELFSSRFEIISNVDSEEYFIGTRFPDMLFLDKKTKSPLYIIEIKKNGAISQCVEQWKKQTTVPATLYIIVPQGELEKAKSVAAITGLNARFGYYTVGENSVISNVIFQ
jgi:hypothetical protein